MWHLSKVFQESFNENIIIRDPEYKVIYNSWHKTNFPRGES